MGKCLLSVVLFLFIGGQMMAGDYKAYLFTYFTGNAKPDESIHFAVSYDGYHYRALNDNQPVISSEKISSTGGVRDPHILRCEDGKGFYMVVTDMVCGKGWDSNRAMVLLKSPDLIHWTSSVVHMQKKGYAGYEDLKRVWAPQTIYDREAGKYLVYWSMKFGDGPDRIYYAYANADFTDIEGEPKPLFLPANGKSCIDGDIVYHNGEYHLFYKTEGHGNGILKAVTRKLTSGKWKEYNRYLQQTDKAVEGSAVFPLTGTGKYILMYDMYTSGRYQFTESTDLQHFRVIDEEISMDFKPRHGTVIPITAAEADRLERHWGNARKRTAYKDAGLKANNPVIRDFHADPAILYARQTGRFYLYPTSDGYDSWGGNSFKAFSSPDLVNWTDEGIILDLPSQVSWADRNAWAPCIIERKVDGNYRYFFYYTAAQKIGVAVAGHPAGPFRDAGRPVVAERPAGMNRGQTIDPEVFCDPVSGKYYLYWGNGFMAVAELSDDMLSIKPETQRVITPRGGTFREGTCVFYRNGKYYFLWSENDTRSEDYRVRYGTAESPVGPIQVPENNLILAKDTMQGIYGTGHNSVIQVPGQDEWYIVYHRFTRPDGIRMGRAAGFHREVCVDRMTFNADGSIRPVKPTVKGIRPLKAGRIQPGESQWPAQAELLRIIDKVNRHWQTQHPKPGNAFWDNAAYHTGNMEAYALTGNEDYRAYSEAWAEHNQWMGARSKDRSKWKYSYGERDEYVLFGDWQICFQTYCDLYRLDPQEHKIARAREVMEYEMSTPRNDYWWWADGLYMVMPVMTKLHAITGNPLYLEKLYEYLCYADSIMYDKKEGLYYRDAKYVYPAHRTLNGKKDFWARGDGWVFAGLAKVLTDLPKDDPHREFYIRKFQRMARAIARCQRPEGYWTRSMLDPEHAPGKETSGTAFFTYGMLWGINHGLLDARDYLPVARKGWEYLSTQALQPDGAVGYVQPIGEKAIPGQVVSAGSTANFGVGAFLLATCELYRYLESLSD